MSQKKRETNGAGAKFVVEMVVPKPIQFCCVVEDWGQSRFLEGYTSHIQIRQVAVPEGLAMVACCLVCGARAEIIADLRPMMVKRGSGATAHVDDFDVLLPSREWLAAHDSCQRGLPPLSTPVRKFVHDRLRAAAAVLGDEHSPGFISLASVKAPFSCPKSSESRNVADSPPQLTCTNGDRARVLSS